MLWIEDAYELLDTPGEWYLDRSSNTLYYVPLAGQDINAVPVVLGNTVRLVEGAGTLNTPLHNVQFDGITFAYDSWIEPSSALGYPDFQGGVVYRGAGTWDDNNYMTPAGVDFTAATHIAVTNSTFTHMANAALALGAGSAYDRIDGNTFTDISGNGIDLGGITKADHHPSDPASIVKNNVISNNTLTKIGVEYRDNVGIFVGYTQGSDVKHNTIYDLPYTGISMGWGWGYIDTLGTSQAKNNVIRGNLIHDVMKAQSRWRCDLHARQPTRLAGSRQLQLRRQAACFVLVSRQRFGWVHRHQQRGQQPVLVGQRVVLRQCGLRRCLGRPRQRDDGQFLLIGHDRRNGWLERSGPEHGGVQALPGPRLRKRSLPTPASMAPTSPR